MKYILLFFLCCLFFWGMFTDLYFLCAILFTIHLYLFAYECFELIDKKYSEKINKALKKFFCFTLTLLLLSSKCLCVYASSEYVPDGVFVPITDEDGHQYYYYEINGGYTSYNTGVSHYCDLQIYLDFSNVFANNPTYDSFSPYLLPFNCNNLEDDELDSQRVSGSSYRYRYTEDEWTSNAYSVSPYAYITGTLDGVYYENSRQISVTDLGNVGKLCGLSDDFITWANVDIIKYLPLWFRDCDASSFQYYPYLSKEPTIDITPQKPVILTSELNGKTRYVNVIMQYPYSTPEDCYYSQNELSYIPLKDNEEINDYLVQSTSVRFTCLIDGTYVSTDFIPLGYLMYDFDGFLARRINDTTGNYAYYYKASLHSDWDNLVEQLINITECESSDDYLKQAINIVLGKRMVTLYDNDTSFRFDLSYVPTLMNKYTNAQGFDSCIVTNFEVGVYNYDIEHSISSDYVYSSYNFDNGNYNSDIVPDSAPSVDIVADDEGNEISVTTVVSPDIIVNIDPSNITIENQPSNVVVNNYIIMPDNDSDGNDNSDIIDDDGLIDWFNDFATGARDTVKKVARMFVELITEINSLVGDFPTLFSWVLDGLPSDYVLWLELGVGCTVVGLIFRRK